IQEPKIFIWISGITWPADCITFSARTHQTHSRPCRRYSSPNYPSRSRSSAFTSVRPPPGPTALGKEDSPTFTLCTLLWGRALTDEFLNPKPIPPFRHRQFITENYTAIKQANPNLPILIREASGIEARAFARYGHREEDCAKQPSRERCGEGTGGARIALAKI
ncbi:hypothetical protein BC937DRAFT_89214, partial [Endogone sp. FLAS-F59071]